MKYIFFLIIFLLPIGIAYGEAGKNFDKEILSVNQDGIKTIEWSSHYERIFNGTDWINYQWSQDGNMIHFESASIIYDSNGCIFTLTNSKNPLEKTTWVHTLTNNGLDVITNCDIQNILPLNDTLVITTLENSIDGKLETQYNITASGTTEWTYGIEALKISTFGVKDICINCEYNGIGFLSDEIRTNGFIIDTKNRIHDTLKEITVGKDIEFIYEGQLLNINEKTIIDPTATLTATSDNSPIEDDNDNVCEDTGSGSATQYDDGRGYSITSATASTNDCARAWQEFDITSITDDSTVTDLDFKFKTALIYSDISQRFYGIKSQQPSTGTALQAFDYIDDDVLYLTTAGFSAGTDYTVDMTSTGESDLTSVLATSQDWFGIGVRLDSETLTASTRGWDYYSLSGGTTQPQLIVVYTEPTYLPNSPTNLNAVAVHNSQINLSWTTPTTCFTGCTGYKIWRESPSGGGFTVLVTNTTTTATTYSNTGLTKNTQYNYKVAAWNHYGLGSNSTASAATTQNKIDAVDTLTATDIRSLSVDLDWDLPSLNGGGGMNVSGFQINKTTPHSNTVGTVVVNNTNTNDTAYTITALTGSTNYTFKIGTFGYLNTVKNESGNVINITTDFDPTAEFTVGTFNISQDNTGVIDIRYTRNDIDANSLFLNITARDTYEVACDLEYKLGGFNQTYTNLPNTTSTIAGNDEIGFWFTNVTNDIIRVDCWNIHSDHEPARYLITRYDRNSTFPLMLQFEQFRDGTFGTAGEFGVFDLITLSAIILSMIGFNRVNPAVGGIFCTVVILFLGWFEIIEMPTIIFSALALVLMLAIGITRSDQN